MGFVKWNFPLRRLQGVSICCWAFWFIVRQFKKSSWLHQAVREIMWASSVGDCHWGLHKVTRSGQGIPKITTIGSCLGGGYFGNSLLLRSYPPYTKSLNHTAPNWKEINYMESGRGDKCMKDGSTWYANSSSWQRPLRYRNNRETKYSTWTLFPAAKEVP